MPPHESIEDDPPSKVSPRTRHLFLKAALASALFFLNVFFAGTSNVLGDALPPSVSWFLVTITFIDAVKLAGYLHILGYYVIDAEALILLTIVGICVFLLTKKAGVPIAVLRTLQAISLIMIVLPIEVYFGDGRDFTVNFTSFQVLSGFLSWFSNADLLIACFTSLVITSFLVSVAASRSKR